MVTRHEGGNPRGFLIAFRILAKFSDISGSEIACAGRIRRRTLTEIDPLNPVCLRNLSTTGRLGILLEVYKLWLE